MPLKVKRVRVERTESEELLRVPHRWGMFTSQGNKRLAQIAQEAHDKIEALCASGAPHGSAVRAVLLVYLVKWVKLWGTKTYGESADTAVRECVGDFHDALWSAAGFGSDIWDEHYDEAQRRVRK